MLVTRGLERVLADLTAMGYDSRWGVVSAADVGANHKRERIWIVAYSKHCRHTNSFSRINGKKVGLSEKDWSQWSGGRMSIRTGGMVGSGETSGLHNERKMGDTESPRFASCFERQGQGQFGGTSFGAAQWWETEPDVGRVADGVAARVDRLKAIGNGQVPLCAATAWKTLIKNIWEDQND